MNDFNIKFRITDDFSSLDEVELEDDCSLEGFFLIFGGGFEYGYYHDRGLRDGEVGFHSIGAWLELLLRCAEYLSVNKYVAIHDFETVGSWIELEWIDESNIRIREIFVKRRLNSYITLERSEECLIKEDNEAIINYEWIKSEIVRVSKSYAETLVVVDVKYLETKKYQSFLGLISSVEG